jgi:hypothetical protein
MVEKSFLVVWYKIEVIEWLECINLFRSWFWLRIVIDEPACDVQVETFRYGIEEILHGRKRLLTIVVSVMQ